MEYLPNEIIYLIISFCDFNSIKNLLSFSLFGKLINQNKIKLMRKLSKRIKIKNLLFSLKYYELPNKRRNGPFILVNKNINLIFFRFYYNGKPCGKYFILKYIGIEPKNYNYVYKHLKDILQEGFFKNGKLVESIRYCNNQIVSRWISGLDTRIYCDNIKILSNEKEIIGYNNNIVFYEHDNTVFIWDTQFLYIVNEADNIIIDGVIYRLKKNNMYFNYCKHFPKKIKSCGNNKFLYKWINDELVFYNNELDIDGEKFYYIKEKNREKLFNNTKNIEWNKDINLVSYKIDNKIVIHKFTNYYRQIHKFNNYKIKYKWHDFGLNIKYVFNKEKYISLHFSDNKLIICKWKDGEEEFLGNINKPQILKIKRDTNLIKKFYLEEEPLLNEFMKSMARLINLYIILGFQITIIN